MIHARIRNAVLGDAPAMCNIYNQAIEGRLSTCDLDPRDEEDIKSWFSDRDFSKRPIWVCEMEGKVAGYLSVSNFWNDRPGYSVTADCGLYIGSEFQNKRIGSYLLNHFLDNAGDLGIHSIVTSMFSNNHASVRLFEKFGFEQVGLCRRVANLEGTWKDLVIVQKGLDQ